MSDDAERVPLNHELPDDLRAALADETASLVALYNGLQDLDDETFTERFAGALATFRDVLNGREEFVACVVGLELREAGGEREVLDAAIVSVHVPNEDGSVDELLHVTDNPPEDEFLLLPVHADDCPPGTGSAASDVDVATFREVVAAMTYQRFDLLQNDLDSYRTSYLRPLVRGLEAYSESR